MMATADSFVETEQVALLLIAKKLMDCLHANIFMPDLPTEAKKPTKPPRMYVRGVEVDRVPSNIVWPELPLAALADQYRPRTFRIDHFHLPILVVAGEVPAMGACQCAGFSAARFARLSQANS